jgi:shikimate dehydrogenase
LRKFGLIGNPLSHSYSARYFKNKFEREAILSTYELFELDRIEALGALLQNQKLSGFNVTIPFKESIFPLLDRIVPEASAIGAVNCVRCADNELIGYNTDAIAFEQSLLTFLETHPKQALVLGNGGSSKAVQFVLSKLNIPFRIVSRNLELNFETLHPNLVHEAHLIVNTTPVGMFPQVQESLDIPYEAIGSQHYIMDLIYNPLETAFLKRCSLTQARTLNGMHMLRIQAEESWKIWNS